MKSYSDNIVDTAALAAVNLVQDEKINALQKEIDRLKILAAIVVTNLVALNVILAVYFH